MTAGRRSPAVIFRFEIAIDDRKMRATNRAGDAIRLRAIYGGGNRLDEALAAGGLEGYEVLYRFAWRALRHHDDYTELTWDDFVDRAESFDVLDNEEVGPVRPTDAGPSNA